MDDNMPDMPLENFGAATEVATPPVANEATPVADNQTTQPTETSGSEEQQVSPSSDELKPTEDNPIVDDGKSGRPEKQDRLQNRFGELTGRIRERDAELEKLQAQIAQMQATGEVTPLQADENGQYSIEDIQRNQTQLAEAIARSQVSNLEARLERETIANRYDNEGTTIETKYKDDFAKNPVHAENIKALIDDTIKFNINNSVALKQISPLKIAEKYMKGIESERRMSQTITAQNLQQTQADQQVAPGSPAKVDDNSDEALEARVANIKF